MKMLNLKENHRQLISEQANCLEQQSAAHCKKTMDRLQRNPAIYKSIYKEIFVKSTKIQDNGYVQLLLKDQNYD